MKKEGGEGGSRWMPSFGSRRRSQGAPPSVFMTNAWPPKLPQHNLPLSLDGSTISEAIRYMPRERACRPLAYRPFSKDGSVKSAPLVYFASERADELN